MPTILIVRGWRFFFYSNEGNEPMHVHARKGEAECKYWIRPEAFDIELDLSTIAHRDFTGKFAR